MYEKLCTVNEKLSFFRHHRMILLMVIGIFLLFFLQSAAFANGTEEAAVFPRSDLSYEDQAMTGYFNILAHRAAVEPFNVIALVIFVLAIAHTLLTSFFTGLAHRLEHEYELLIKEGLRDKHSHSIPASFFHLLGEIEVVFGFWAVFLAIAIATYYDWSTFVHYVEGLEYIEPLFVIVIMVIASSRPIIKLFELVLWRIVRIIGDSLETWWVLILFLSGILGAFITEPAAMAVSALLLADKFYSLGPSKRLKYATLALLFVNISIGGSLTNFASPPVMMVAGPWSWDMNFMLTTFGWKTLLALVANTASYYILIRGELGDMKEAYENAKFKRYIQRRFISQKELEENFTELEKLVDKRVHFTSELNAYSIILKENIKDLAHEKLTPEECEKYDISNAIDEKFDGIVMEEMAKSIPGLTKSSGLTTIYDSHWDEREDQVPYWIMGVHVFFLVWTVIHAETPVLFLAGFLFFLGFYQVTEFYQNRLDLKSPLLVAFFLSGIMIHGTLQAWWIAPLLGRLNPLHLNIAATVLTAFNDNAAITYLSTLVPDFPASMRYAVVSGALTGGGLTIIANAPNPIGQSVLKRFFETGISAGKLFQYALLPTLLTALIYNFFS
ncbi:hypothetical protein KHM83_06490 [Fusibacter paucivorans]|uniref:Na+/H+ antiporter n=1 Tax=Fusibacter paucivorans TaxID=76009 RepID=A0ABS5PMB7_9FIRM|nr:putative Na+/H+ antiporter [Fusibacter paucivorans]MBS7526319.1 hypothetical protein [Fusibacter paucivorans]